MRENSQFAQQVTYYFNSYNYQSMIYYISAHCSSYVHMCGNYRNLAVSETCGSVQGKATETI